MGALARRATSLKRDSRDALEANGYDPINELVTLHHRLLAEDQFWSMLRENPRMYPVRYSGMTHANILSQIEKVASQLLRYGYRAVDNIAASSSETPRLVISLNSEVEWEHCHDR